MLVDLHREFNKPEFDFFSGARGSSLLKKMVYNGVRLIIVPLPDTANSIGKVEKELRLINSSAEKSQFIVVKSKGDLSRLEVKYSPRLVFHLNEFTDCSGAEYDCGKIKSFKRRGLHSIGSSSGRMGQCLSDNIILHLIKNKIALDLAGANKKTFWHLLNLAKDKAYISSLDILNLGRYGNPSSSELTALFKYGGMAGISMEKLNLSSVAAVRDQARLIKNFINKYGGDNVGVATGSGSFFGTEGEIAPASELWTELLRLGVSDTILHGIYFKNAYDFLGRIL